MARKVIKGGYLFTVDSEQWTAASKNHAAMVIVHAFILRRGRVIFCKPPFDFAQGRLCGRTDGACAAPAVRQKLAIRSHWLRCLVR